MSSPVSSDLRHLSLLDLEGGVIHSTHDRGEPAPEPWKPPYEEPKWSSDRDHVLLERIDSARTRSLILFSFAPVRTSGRSFTKEGLRATVHELRGTFWAPDGQGMAFLVAPGPLQGPTRLYYEAFDGAAPKEVDRVAGAPNTVAVDWDVNPPKLR